MEIEWTDADPDSGEKRYVRAEKFARLWRFKVRFRRRTEWDRNVRVTRDMWETLLDALERRYRRREGVSDEDIAAVKKVLATFKDLPEDDREDGIHHRGTEDTEAHREEK